MNGEDVVNAVASRLGMKTVSAVTNPTRAHILEWINIAKAEVVKRHGANMPELIKSETAAAATLTLSDEHAGILLVYDSENNIVTEFLPPKKYYAHIKNDRDDKIVWTYAPTGGDGAVPSGWIKIMISSDPTSCLVYFTRMPDNWTDAAAEPTVQVPQRYIPLVIDVATSYGLIAENRDQIAMVMKSKDMK